MFSCKSSSSYDIHENRGKKPVLQNIIFKCILEHRFCYFCYVFHECQVVLKFCKLLKVLSMFHIKKFRFVAFFSFSFFLLFIRAHMRSGSEQYITLFVSCCLSFCQLLHEQLDFLSDTTGSLLHQTTIMPGRNANLRCVLSYGKIYHVIYFDFR